MGEYENPAPSRNDQLTILDLVGVLVRRKWLIIGITVVIAGVFLAFLIVTSRLPTTSLYNLYPDQFTATARILIQDTTQGSSVNSLLNQSGLGALSGLLGGTAAGGATSSDLAMALLASNTVRDAIAREFEFVSRYNITITPKTKARRMIAGATKAKYDEKTGILDVSYTDINSDFASQVVNRMVDLLQGEFHRLTLDKVTTKRQYLEETIAVKERETEDASNALIAFQRKYGVIDLTAQAQQNIQTVAQLQSQIYTKQVELELQRRYLPETDSRIVQARDQIEELGKLVNALKEGSSDFSTGTVSQKQLQTLSLQYLDLQRELQILQGVLGTLKQQLESTKIEEMNTSQTFLVIEKAEVPEQKSVPARRMSAIVATLVAFIIGIFVAFVVEYVASARRDPVEAEKLASIRAGLYLRRRNSRK